MIEDTESYYRRRWKEELEAAEKAADPIAAEIHRSLAERYAAFCGEPQPAADWIDIAPSKGSAGAG